MQEGKVDRGGVEWKRDARTTTMTKGLGRDGGGAAMGITRSRVINISVVRRFQCGSLNGCIETIY